MQKNKSGCYFLNTVYIGRCVVYHCVPFGSYGTNGVANLVLLTVDVFIKTE